MNTGFRGSNDGSSLSGEFLWEEPGGTAALIGTQKDMLIKALEMLVCFYKGPVFGNITVRSFSKAFDKWENFVYLGKHFVRNLRDV